ncbi:MAG: hypothetical protein JRH20_28675 [Deltaproteobacteria bacterium]|nr:hypothetical protein [Deltaproteobacteria bacterium]
MSTSLGTEQDAACDKGKVETIAEWKVSRFRAGLEGRYITTLTARTDGLFFSGDDDHAAEFIDYEDILDVESVEGEIAITWIRDGAQKQTTSFSAEGTSVVDGETSTVLEHIEEILDEYTEVDDDGEDDLEAHEYTDADGHAALCGSCGVGIKTTYFKIGKAISCAACTEAAIKARDSGGWLRFLKATGAGCAAGALCGAFYADFAASASDVYLAASIGIGLAVGEVVRRASSARGGWSYQLLAMTITYLAIALASVPAIVARFEHLEGGATEQARGRHEGVSTSVVGSGRVNDIHATITLAGFEHNYHGMDFGFYAFVIGVASILPFLTLPESVPLLLFTSLGLIAAWFRNRRRRAVMILGPYAMDG